MRQIDRHFEFDFCDLGGFFFLGPFGLLLHGGQFGVAIVDFRNRPAGPKLFVHAQTALGFFENPFRSLGFRIGSINLGQLFLHAVNRPGRIDQPDHFVRADDVSLIQPREQFVVAGVAHIDERALHFALQERRDPGDLSDAFRNFLPNEQNLARHLGAGIHLFDHRQIAVNDDGVRPTAFLIDERFDERHRRIKIAAEKRRVDRRTNVRDRSVFSPFFLNESRSDDRVFFEQSGLPGDDAADAGRKQYQ